MSVCVRETHRERERCERGVNSKEQQARKKAKERESDSER